VSQHDYLVRILTRDGHFRAVSCTLKTTVAEICRRHGTMPAASAALGRALVGGALLGSQLKGNQRLALKFEANGPLQKILVEADHAGNVCGAVGEPSADVRLPDGTVDVPRTLGLAGFLTVTRDLGLKEPYRGMVQLSSSRIGDDLAAYLTESEQVPSAVGVGVYLGEDGGVGAAGGFLVQALPPQDEQLIDLLMERIAALPPLAESLRRGMAPEEFLAAIFPDQSWDVLERRELRFRCSCSRQRSERALVSLGRQELLSLAERGEPSAVTCEFCRETYAFAPDELRALAEERS
jgi:molecular chaperone Hsp33